MDRESGRRQRVVEVSRKWTVQLGRRRRRMRTQFRWRRYTGNWEERRTLYGKTRGRFPLRGDAGNPVGIGRTSGSRF
ncbi:hypothetical protein NP493_38g03064 [Ridgeia piscesae]|uniref:Uncharacterized protein n=1 Tax=Ridgeia piscesae TaxID=27915 RepID=A0AAD9PCD1_RIDPI|nr:hypothetical protein NP493_38g03064 [Ridgeia piscesae]